MVCLFSKEKKKGHELGGWVGRKNLGGVGEEEIVIRLCGMKRKFPTKKKFNIKQKHLKTCFSCFIKEQCWIQQPQMKNTTLSSHPWPTVLSYTPSGLLILECCCRTMVNLPSPDILGEQEQLEISSVPQAQGVMVMLWHAMLVFRSGASQH